MTVPIETPAGIVDPLVLEAILSIESGGQGINVDGSVKIRFEAFVFKGQLRDDALFAKNFRYGEPSWTGQAMQISGKWAEIHTGTQASEWAAYRLAATLNPIAAARSISMGAPQIMGFNHARIGYASAQAMLKAFRSPNVQVIGFLNFLLSDPALWAAVKAHDWQEIARRYNGNVDVYAPLLERKYRELNG